MESRKLTKADLDKVRDIEGFPIADDEDIIALSDAPYYTACPNPYIEDFIAENGTVYNEATDDYHKEPFTFDISEGKHDPLYMAHSYHTKVPYKAIMHYILHYTKPRDIVFDGFCGTGMTGVAAQLCGDYASCFSVGESNMDNVGSRKAILCDLSPEAGFIAYNCNSNFDLQSFVNHANRILEECQRECGWVYETSHTDTSNQSKGTINYTIWSEVYVCPNCSKEINYWEAAVEPDREKMKKKPICPHCGAEVSKGNCQKAIAPMFDEQTGEVSDQAKCVPVRIVYDYNGKRFTKTPDENDLEVINKISDMKIGYWYPTNKMMNIGKEWGDYWRQYHIGITRVNHFYFKRNLFVLAKCFNCIENVR